jgi:hypothetical protein
MSPGDLLLVKNILRNSVREDIVIAQGFTPHDNITVVVTLERVISARRHLATGGVWSFRILVYHSSPFTVAMEPADLEVNFDQKLITLGIVEPPDFAVGIAETPDAEDATDAEESTEASSSPDAVVQATRGAMTSEIIFYVTIPIIAIALVVVWLWYYRRHQNQTPTRHRVDPSGVRLNSRPQSDVRSGRFQNRI